MTRQEEYQEFLRNLFEVVLDEFNKTVEAEALAEKRKQFYLRLSEPSINQDLLDDCIFEKCLDEESKAFYAYQKGLSDGIFLLKQLGALA